MIPSLYAIPADRLSPAVLTAGCTNGSARRRILEAWIVRDEARQDTPDMGDRQREDLIGIEIRAVDDESVLRRDQGRHRATAVARVALPHVLQNAAVYSRKAPFPQLLVAPPGAGFQAGIDIDLD